MTAVRIGVVGLGAIAQSVHLPLISRRWDLFELAAVADASPTLLAQVGDQYGVDPAHRHESLGALLHAGTVDAVVLLTSGSHGTDALAAIGQGVPVLCEKPLAFSLEEAEALRAAEEAQGRPMLLLGYMKEYDPAVRALAAAMPALGDVRYVGVEVLHPSGQSQLGYANLRPPAGDIPKEVLAGFREADRLRLDSALGADAPDTVRKLYANVVLGSLIHDLALVRSLFGPLETVNAVHHWAQQDEPGSIEITGTLGAGIRFHLNWHYLADYPEYRETITVHHTQGTAELQFGVPYLLNSPTRLRTIGRDAAGVLIGDRREVTEAFETEWEAFHAMVTRKQAPPTGIPEGITDIGTAQRVTAVLVRALGLEPAGEVAQA
ncbi:Gfo/Idh/MocA family oxidoreductase [Sinomonas sp.]|uniref:Gfo/Idh/MocA family oxidoreductase n=1 Tax=Sinomonas sp. TaxID=1914986 RepID=UPI002FE0DE4B